jgi:L-alanine-DL-glutamate epimerase-like enolase superfamily enzyme
VTSSVRIHVSAWPLGAVFSISRGSKTQAEVIVVDIERDGVTGRGECVPYARYGETIASVKAQLEQTKPWVQAGGERESLAAQLPAGAARNALDCALWDVAAKATGQRVWTLAGIGAPETVVTAYTLSLDTPAAMAKSAATHAARPLLKLKLDRNDPVGRVQAVHEAAPNAQLIVDANEAWQPSDLDKWLPALSDLGVAMVEQPLPAGRDEALVGLSSPIPIGADESCHIAEDVARLRDRYQMVNIKLDKSGGLTEALRVREAALTAELQFMVGCMVGTSLSMAPAMLLTPGARFVDLDGPLLLANDRQPGLTYSGAQVLVPTSDVWG